MPVRSTLRVILHPGVAIALASAVSLTAAPAARATITPEAGAVIERYLEVTGGRAAFEAERTVHYRASVSGFGFKGTVEGWWEQPDHAAQRTELGPFKLRTGTGGGSAWRTDPTTSKVVKLDGKDLDNAIGSAFHECDAWMRVDQSGASVTVTGADKDSLGSYTVVEVAPPKGRARRYWFNRTTGLIDRSESRNDQQTVVARVLDYRKMAGRLRAGTTVTSVVGMPANALTATQDTVWINETLDPVIFELPAAEASSTVWLKSPGRARLPFHYGGKHLWLQASIDGGPPADFIYDTGASITVIDSAYAARIGLATEGRMQAQGAAASGGASFAKIGRLRVASPDSDGVELADVKVGVLSVSASLEPFFWRPIAGVLGYDFISRFVSRIDYDHETLTLIDPKSFEYKGPGTPIPMRLAGTIPAIRMKIDGRYEGEFRVDVGSGSTVDLHTPFVRANQLSKKARRKVEVMGGGFGGAFTTELCRMKRLEVGPFAWKDPLVSLSEATSGALASEDYSGNIGNRILERFTCTFDYERRQLILEPGRLYPGRDPFTRLGAQLARYGDEVKAMQVLEGSAAARAGLKEGDRIASIDGRPAASCDPDELERQFTEGPAGTVHTFEVVRAGRNTALKIRLRELL